jgi:hypothetical protein
MRVFATKLRLGGCAHAHIVYPWRRVGARVGQWAWLFGITLCMVPGGAYWEHGGLQKKKKNHSYLRGYQTSSSPAHCQPHLPHLPDMPHFSACEGMLRGMLRGMLQAS